jgi:hypothetical protein
LLIVTNLQIEAGEQIMILNPLKILTKKFRIKTWFFFMWVAVYIGISFFCFFQWVAPSLDGRTDQHIAADSTTYIYFADSLREDRADPLVIAALSAYPNNLWFPVLLALLLKSTFAMVLANYAMFFLALVLLKKSFSFSIEIFITLLLLNATTTISLLSVNKEIVDLLAVSIFFFAYRRHRYGVLLLALLFTFINRFEVCMVMLLFLFAQSKLNPLRRRRVMTLIALIIALSLMLPLLASNSLNERFQEASSGQTIAQLDLLEMHYLYGVAVIPKIAETFFGEILNVSKWETSYTNFSDIANSYILLSNNLATVVVLLVLVKKRTLVVRSDLIYFAMLGCIVMAVSLVIQPRYVYFAYVLLCLQAASLSANQPLVVFSSISHREIENA